jgi:hypothetical protein
MSLVSRAHPPAPDAARRNRQISCGSEPIAPKTLAPKTFAPHCGAKPSHHTATGAGRRNAIGIVRTMS